MSDKTRIYVGRKHPHIPFYAKVTLYGYSRPWYMKVIYQNTEHEVAVGNLRKPQTSPLSRKITPEFRRELELLTYKRER